MPEGRVHHLTTSHPFPNRPLDPIKVLEAVEDGVLPTIIPIRGDPLRCGHRDTLIMGVGHLHLPLGVHLIPIHLCMGMARVIAILSLLLCLKESVIIRLILKIGSTLSATKKGLLTITVEKLLLIPHKEGVHPWSL